MSSIPCLRIALTSGEPAGIGPDLLVELAEEPFPHELVAIDDPKLLQARAKRLRKKICLKNFDRAAPPKPKVAGALTILPVPLLASCMPGKLTHHNAPYVLECLKQGGIGCLNHTFSALVTGPVQKSIFHQAGIPFIGQTEFLAKLCKTRDVVMMLASPNLRVALATTHLPLRHVASHIKPQKLQKTLEILHQALKEEWGIPHPHIDVCGLNPHAGEGGALGREEIEVIQPVIKYCQKMGMLVSGPYPADTVFKPLGRTVADVILAMYHDQGLPVLKYQGFGEAVNVTLGLPIIRTSVDHGTALELAGTGQASSSSFRQALMLAVQMAL
ncbi:MAG: 4-hydroxythreonine-4-phosphate dehydrogenase PdxA [Gammaproteobacteria bacterium]|nr:4-hydroxythreonine-4-phosphate dehydrogenase PdxA [Gammaproteobacteria bacterium]